MQLNLCIHLQYGEEAIKEGMGSGGGGGGMSDIFDLFGGGGGRRQQPRERRGENVVHKLKVSLEEMYSGGVRKLSLSRNIKCDTCSGSGTKSGRRYQCEVRQPGSLDILCACMHVVSFVSLASESCCVTLQSSDPIIICCCVDVQHVSRTWCGFSPYMVASSFCSHRELGFAHVTAASIALNIFYMMMQCPMGALNPVDMTQLMYVHTCRCAMGQGSRSP